MVWRRNGGFILATLWPWLRPYRWLYAQMVAGDILALSVRTLTPFVIASAIDGPIAHNDSIGIWHYAWMLLLLAIVQTILSTLRHLPTADMVNIETALRRAIYYHVQRLPILHHDSHGTGHVLSRLIGDVATIGLALQQTFVFMTATAMSLLLTAAMMVAIQPTLGITVVLAMMPLGLASMVFQNRFRRSALRARESASSLATSVEESALAIRVLKAIGGRPFISTRFDLAAKQSYNAELEKIQLNAIFTAAVAGYPILISIIVVLGGARAVVLGAVSVGDFVAFAAFYFRMLAPVNSMGAQISYCQEALNAIARVGEILGIGSNINDPSIPQLLPVGGPMGVHFKEVSFSYPEGGAPILSGLNLDVQAGETVALVGATGSGKTTLATLVARLADVQEGSLLVGGIDVRLLKLATLRRSIGMAFEEAYLFSDTIRENLIMGRDGINDDEIERVLAITQSGFVKDLPQGLDTLVGEQGSTLSGGQRQRIALARALLGSPRILVLDEPISALDVRTAAAVERALRLALRDVTTLIICRRPSTILLADRVALLDDAHIVDIGKHDELLSRSALYRDILIPALGPQVEDADA